MSHCSTCGAPVHEDAKFCSSCGNALTKPEPAEQKAEVAVPAETISENRRACPHCGKEVPAKARICMYCQRPLDAPRVEAQGQPVHVRVVDEREGVIVGGAKAGAKGCVGCVTFVVLAVIALIILAALFHH
jgi:predicted amidophosphoribosyltransferase